VKHVMFADRASEFVNALGRAERSTPEQRRLQIEYARAFSWTQRTDDALGLIEQLAAS
jgi:hypothetical protein